MMCQELKTKVPQNSDKKSPKTVTRSLVIPGSCGLFCITSFVANFIRQAPSCSLQIEVRKSTTDSTFLPKPCLFSLRQFEASMISLRVRASLGESQSLIDVAGRCLINTSESSLKGDGAKVLLETVQ